MLTSHRRTASWSRVNLSEIFDFAEFAESSRVDSETGESLSAGMQSVPVQLAVTCQILDVDGASGP